MVNVGLLVLDQCVDQYSVLGAAKLIPQADILVHRSQNIVNTQHTMCIQASFSWPECEPLAPCPVCSVDVSVRDAQEQNTLLQTTNRQATCKRPTTECEYK